VYALNIIRRRLEAAGKRLGWTPEYHSVAAARSAADHLRALWDEERGAWLRPLNRDEMRWISNERALAFSDAMYALTRYCHIKDWKNEIVLFEPNVAQRIVLEIIAGMEEVEREIMLQILKARQLGISTLIELLISLRVQTIAGVNAVIASNDPDKSLKMSQMAELNWKLMPPWLLPEQTKYKAGELIEFGNQDSALSIQHGAQFTGIARGTTVTVVHLSELADFINPEQLVDASLLRAMHPSPNVFAAFESTAAGLDNWWHKTWNLSKAGYKNGRARMCPVFLPWYVGTDLYPSETARRTRPIPSDWIASTAVINHAERARAYVRSNELLGRHLGQNWQMSRDQMWFWEYTRDEYKAKNQLPIFYQEMPASDHEAFQSTNISAFDADTIADYREACTKIPDVYAIVAEDIPLRMHPDRRDIDLDKPTLVIRYNAYASERPIRKEFRFVPVKFEGYSNTDPNGKLFIWEHPKPGFEYGLGVDTGDGLGLDGSICEVLRKGTVNQNDEQVAEWASPYVNAHDLAPICLAIATYYRGYDVPGFEGEIRDPKIVVECQRNGESTQHELRKLGWSHFHRWVRYDSTRIRKLRATKLGVVMVPWFRSMMLDFLIKYLRDGWCDINSPWFVNEMQRLERDEMEQSLKANYGGHDDRIMAFGMVLFSIHDMEVRGISPALAEQRQEQKHHEFATWKPGLQESDFYVDSEMPQTVLTYREDYG
jgi:hypothetical protein